MNHTQNVYRGSSDMPTAQPSFIADPRPTWRRPTITIIDVKRTIAALGAYTDGGTGSSF